MSRIIAYILGFALLVCCSPRHVRSDCAVFNIFDHLDSLPIILRVKVNRSAIPSCGAHAESSCLYSFSAEILEKLKGDVEHTELHFSYRYWLGCPGVDTFEEGREYILALKTVADDGLATLHGVSCGAWGSDISQIEKLRRALGRDTQ